MADRAGVVSTAAGTNRAWWIGASRAFLVFTVGYNVLEGLIAVGSGFAAGSIALVGFGLDSFIEVFAAGLLLFQFGHLVHERDGHEAAARRAEVLIGLTFFLLAAYVVAEALFTLVAQEEPGASWVGIGLAIASLAIMPALGVSKRASARRLCIRALEAEAKETLICAGLSLVLLLGLGLNALWGLWWADPAAALAMVPYIAWEGWESVAGEADES